MSGPPHPRLRLLAVNAALATTLGLLAAPGSRLPGPMLAMHHGLALGWVGGLDPADAVIGIVHALAVGAVAYLLGAAVLEAAVSTWARRTGRPAGRGCVRLPWASTVVRWAAGLGLALSVGGGLAASSAAAGVSAGPPVVMHLDQATTAPVMHLVPTVPAPTHGPDVWTIRPGDHLWKVAGSTLTQARGRPADDAAILAYVREIVRTNADVFVVPGDPDLVYPGQRFVLPPVALT